MKKYIALSFCLASVLQAASIRGEFTIGADASIGVEGTSEYLQYIPSVIKLVKSRPDIFDEAERPSNNEQAPDTGGGNQGGNSNPGGGTNPGGGNNSGGSNNNNGGQKKESPASVVLRNVKIEKTLLDGKLYFDDIYTTLGVMIKGRPNRLDQATSLSDVSRAYLYAKHNSDFARVNVKLNLLSEEDANHGIQKYIDGESRENKKNRTFEISGDITPVNPKLFPISPVFSFDYQQNNTYSYRPGVAFHFEDGDEGEFTLSVKYRGEKDKHKVLGDFNEVFSNLGAGNKEIEYFKNWELGAPEEDKKYNEKKEIEGNEGKAAYRYIGKRDIEQGHLSGTLGSIRSVGTPTGALYGDSITNLVLDDFLLELSKIFPEGEAIYKTLSNNISTGDLISLGLKMASDSSIIGKINEITADDDLMLSLVVKSLLKTLKVAQKGDEVSDYYLTNLIPREYRKFVKDLVPDVPYENTEANIKYLRENPTPGSISFASLDGNAPVSFEDTTKLSEYAPVEFAAAKANKPYETDNDKKPELGSNRKDKGERTLLEDLLALGTKGEFDDIAKIVIESGTKDLKASLTKKIVSEIISTQLNQKAGFFGKIANSIITYFKPDLTLEKGVRFQHLAGKTENLRLFDAFLPFQINKSEYDHRKIQAYNNAFNKLQSGSPILLKDYDEKFEKEKETKGLEVNLKYKTKNIPLTITNNIIYSSYGSHNEGIIKTYGEGKIRPERYIGKILGHGGKLAYDFNYENIVLTHQKTEFKAKESVQDIKNDFAIEYDGEKFDLDSGVDFSYKKTLYNEKEYLQTLDYYAQYYKGLGDILGNTAYRQYQHPEGEILKTTNLSYEVVHLKPYLQLSYKFEPTSQFEIKPRIAYNGDYKYANVVKFVSQEDGLEEQHLTVERFKRDKDNKLIKAGGYKSKSDYYNNLKEGDSVDLSKISKFAVDVEKAFEKEKVKPEPSWYKAENAITLGMDVYYKFNNNFKVGYHYVSPILFKGTKFDGFAMKNGLSLTASF